MNMISSLLRPSSRLKDASLKIRLLWVSMTSLVPLVVPEVQRSRATSSLVTGVRLFAGCPSPFTDCPGPFAGCPSPFADCPDLSGENASSTSAKVLQPLFLGRMFSKSTTSFKLGTASRTARMSAS